MNYLYKQSAKDLQHLQSKLLSLNKPDNMISTNPVQRSLTFRHAAVQMAMYQVLHLKPKSQHSRQNLTTTSQSLP